jgi:hypothetical protein
LARQLAEKSWESLLLRSQLKEAETKINELTKSGAETEAAGFAPGPELAVCISDNILCLKRIKFDSKPGQLIAVVGGVGCGE